MHVPVRVCVWAPPGEDLEAATLLYIIRFRQPKRTCVTDLQEEEKGLAAGEPGGRERGRDVEEEEEYEGGDGRR